MDRDDLQQLFPLNQSLRLQQLFPLGRKQFRKVLAVDAHAQGGDRQGEVCSDRLPRHAITKAAKAKT